MIKPLTRILESFGRKLPIVRPLFAVYYNRLCEREVDAVHIEQKKKVLFIGAGAYPYSAIYYAKTGADVTAIDVDDSAVQAARHYEHARLRFLQADGVGFNMAKYDTIVVAKQVEEKAAVMNQIFKTAKKRARVLVRSGKGCPCIKGCAAQALNHRGRLVKTSWLMIV